MKNLNNILIKVMMSSGLFLNATAQDDLTGLHIPEEFQTKTKVAFAVPVNNSLDNNCCTFEEASVTETKSEGEEAESDSWIESENPISIAELPKAILKTLVKEYEAYALLEVEEIETSVRDAYRLSIVQENAQWDIYISSRGDILMEERIN